MFSSYFLYLFFTEYAVFESFFAFYLLFGGSMSEKEIFEYLENMGIG